MLFFAIGLALILAGGLFGPAMGRSGGSPTGDRWFQIFVGAGSLIAAIDGVRTLTSGAASEVVLHATTPGGDWVFGLDALSAVFLIVTLVVGALCAVYGTRYLRDDDGSRRWWFSHATFAVLLCGLALVVVARSVVVFLMAWEVMAIASYFLIVTDAADESVRRAGLIYLAATHTATLALFAMFALWSGGSHDWTFTALRAAWPALGGASQTAVLLLALFAFGVKAGAVPMHVWLPPAHSAAPSHVSAIMSGLVIKTGIYGLLRVLLIAGGAPAWWGWTVLACGTASAVLGVLWALAQHDIKRLLAYHSVENIGIILMGVGTGVLGVAYGHPAVAALGFAGAVLHTVNHAVFKSLLFLAAGAVYRATGTRNLESLGGLARRMPLTWIGFAIGATAIIGVPPLNGFVSEWLVFQGLFGAGSDGGALRPALLGIPALALVGALALACFAKVAGVVFLGSPREARTFGDVERYGSMTGPILALAAMCVVLGVVPFVGVAFVRDAASALAGFTPSLTPPAGGDVAPAVALALDSALASARGVAVVAVAVAILALLLWGGRALLLRRAGVRTGPTWGCAFPATTPRMQYTGSSFAAPLLSLFGPLSGVHTKRTAASFETHATDIVLDDAALPAWRALQRAALRLRPIQQGRLSSYLLYVMAALVALLAYLSIGLRR